MKLVDVLVVVTLLLMISIIVYFAYVKNKHVECKGCPYRKRCNKVNCQKEN